MILGVSSRQNLWNIYCGFSFSSKAMVFGESSSSGACSGVSYSWFPSLLHESFHCPLNTAAHSWKADSRRNPGDWKRTRNPTILEVSAEEDSLDTGTLEETEDHQHRKWGKHNTVHLSYKEIIFLHFNFALVLLYIFCIHAYILLFNDLS